MANQTKPSITIMFDDDSESIYTQAYTRMSALGLKGSNARITGAYGTGLLSTQQYQEMYDAGWSIVSHTVHHYHLTELSDEDVISEISGAKASLESSGWTRCSDLIVFPYNDTDERVLSLAAPYIRGATWKVGPFIGANDYPVDRLRIKRHGAGTSTPSEVMSWVDDAIYRNQHLHLYFHAIGTPSDGYTYDPEGFQQIIEHIALKRDQGLIDALTMDELVNFLLNMDRKKNMPRVLIRDFGSSLKFNGGQKVVNTDSLTTVSSACTASAWFKVAGTSAGQGILQIGNGTTSRLAVSVQTGLVRGGFYNGTAYVSKSGPVTPSKWYHVACVWDGSTAALYINGVPQTGTSVPISTSFTGVEIGVSSSYFTGNITDVNVWSSALTPAQISALYYNSIVPQENLWLSWKLDEGSGSTVIDSSNNNRNGTITGATYSTETPQGKRRSID